MIIKLIKVTALIIGCLSVLSPSLLATTYTESTIAAAESRLNSPGTLTGDIVQLVNGTYRNFEMSINRDDVTFRAQNDGQVTFREKAIIKLKGDRITLEGFYFYEAWWLDSATSNVTLVGANHCKVRNIVFQRCGKDNPSGRYHSCIMVRGGSSDNMIEKCFFSSLYEAGVHFQNRTGDTNNLRNKIQDSMFVKNIGFHNGMESIRTGHGDVTDSKTYTEIRRCYFSDVQGDGEIVSIKSSYATVVDCTFINCPDKGHLSIRGGNNALIEGNWFLNTKVGIRIFGENHIVQNNFMRNVGTGIVVPGGRGTDYQAARNCKVIYNTVMNPSKVAYDFGSSYTDETCENIIFKNNIAESNVNGADLSRIDVDIVSSEIKPNHNFLWATGGAQISHLFNATVREDPELKWCCSWVYKLDSTSPCRDVAGGTSPLMYDIDSEIRGASPDVGADEYSTHQGYNLPLAWSELGNGIGPDWK